ncbi:MAG: hypothetical protein JSR62_01085 [Nitrospira sp.]|nr:hypothetical protein [Nitrospira sp.]
MPNHAARSLFIACALIAGLTIPIAGRSEEPAPTPQAPAPTLNDRLPAFQNVARANASQLAVLPSQGDALGLFKTALGPQLGLQDAAMTIGAKGLTPTMSRELLMTDLTRSATELVRALAAWQLAHATKEVGLAATAEQRQALHQQIEAQLTWFTEGTPLEPSLKQIQALNGEAPMTEDRLTQLGGAAAHIESWAIDTAHREWFRIYNWKDQVRQQRGLTRLCGTWQWSIHNHQNHREEKTSVIFAPPGLVVSNSPAEITVLGDSVYLRWETRAGVQEDSLLFSAEGQRLEGTFVNTAGGWGSITGKRTATCFNEGGKATVSPRRQHH